nr:MFS transporter [uncultured Rhodopila sp.]
MTATTRQPGHRTGAGDSTRLIVAASLGNALEFYEILVYGYFAVTISKVFFPNTDETVSLLVTLGTFGITFLARPVGALWLGAYGDRAGRKKALTLSIALMTAGTGIMTIMPGYQSIGVVAPILVLAARLLQGFSVGGEFAASTSFLVEHRPDRAGFFASWQWASQGMAALAATGFGVVLTTAMPVDQLQSWGWRIPFAAGLLIGPVGYYIRNRLEETPPFLNAEAARRPLRDVAVEQWDRLLLAIGVVVISTSSQYMLVYMPTYALRQLALPPAAGFTAGAIAAALQVVAVPFVGILADRIGQTRIMMGAALLFICTAYPAFALLAARPSLSMLILTVCWISALKSCYSGALPSLMAALFPTRTRVTGLSLSYNISVVIFGGFAPFYAAWLIDMSGSKLAPSYYVMITAAVSLATLVLIRRRFKNV